MERGYAVIDLGRCCGGLRDAGIAAVYLVTDHTSFNERYGWEFLCMAQGEAEPLRMYVRGTESDRTDVANISAL